jgi:hypothetical protein
MLEAWMTLADLQFKIKVLANFQLNLKRSNGNISFEKLLINQAKKVVFEIDQAIHKKTVKSSDAIDLVKKYKLQKIMRLVRNDKN